MTDESEFFFYSSTAESGELTKVTFDTYDEMVKAKRRRNVDMLSSSGLLKAAEEFKDGISSVTKKTASQRGIAKRKSTRREALPPRKSSRLRGIASDGNFVEHEGRGVIVTNQEPNDGALSILGKEDVKVKQSFNNRINDGSPLSVNQALDLLDNKWKASDDIRTISESFMHRLKALQIDSNYEKSSSSAVVSSSLQDHVKILRADDSSNVAKVVPGRIYAMACHPSSNTDSLIVCAGDKQGYLGLWNVNSSITTDAKSDGVHLFRPHNGPITHLEWNSNGSSLFSVSYDGTVREFDVNSQRFTEVFATYDDSDEFKGTLGFGVDEGYRFWVQHGILDHRNDRCIFLSTSTGSVIHIDTRMGKKGSGMTFNQKGLSEKKINTIDLHRDGRTLATCGLDNTIKLWDVRKFGFSAKAPKPLAYQICGKSISSAFFSPSGETLLATTMSDTLELTKVRRLLFHRNTQCCFDLNFINSCQGPHLQTGLMKAHTRIRHNNHTGRWLSTLMARWHPSEDLFVVGCMKQPRRIEIFDGSDGSLVSEVLGDSLTAVASRCCFHPRADIPIICGGNSSGRVTILMNP